MTSLQSSSSAKNSVQCQSPDQHREEFWVERPAHPAPVLSQILFGLSFVVFLGMVDRLKDFTPHARSLSFAWSVAQALLGAWVIRARLRAKKRIWRCIRCNPALR